jgi:signal transduction histidine kinase
METAKIMIVEDEAIVAMELKAVLGQKGFTITSVESSGEQAILSAAKDCPDLILMDIFLKGEVDGIEAASQIYSKFNIPVIYLFAYSEKKTLDRTKTAEPFGFLTKPVNQRDLHNTITFVLYKHQAEIEKRQAKNENKRLEAQLRQSQKMESLGTLASGIAHDFNNILFPIVGHAEMLLEDIPHQSPFRESLAEIHTGALRARELVKQILTFSRQKKHDFELINLKTTIEEVLKMLRATIPATINIQQDFQEDCGFIKADPTQIYQVVMNLTTNACHAMADTGGQLRVSLNEVKLDHRHLISPDLKPGFHALLTVTDYGIVMRPELIEKIFNKFFTTRKAG